ncbi:MAG: septum formation initiator family protein [Treponema sp.]|jgi:cell division protein FtsB|nr:septum formation initiator family protein [Treponema sp.]
MKLKYLLVPWTAAAVYALSSMYAGASGVLPYGALLKEQERLLDNLEELKSVNQNLEGTAAALLYDPETVTVQARELGYGKENERFIRIAGLSGARNRELTPGTAAAVSKPDFIPDRYLKAAALLAGFAVFCLLVISDLLGKLRRE